MTRAPTVWAVGDEVLIDDNHPSTRRPLKLAKVEKVTKTQITAGGMRFVTAGYEDFGRLHGASRFDTTICRRATPEQLADNERRVQAATAEQLADNERRVQAATAEGVCFRASQTLRYASGERAIRLAAMIEWGGLGGEWLRSDNSDSILLYTLKDQYDRRGHVDQVNDLMVRIENANGSAHDLKPIAERIIAALNGQVIRGS